MAGGEEVVVVSAERQHDLIELDCSRKTPRRSRHTPSARAAEKSSPALPLVRGTASHAIVPQEEFPCVPQVRHDRLPRFGPRHLDDEIAAQQVL
jgi:hypothetical protein